MITGNIDVSRAFDGLEDIIKSMPDMTAKSINKGTSSGRTTWQTRLRSLFPSLRIRDITRRLQIRWASSGKLYAFIRGGNIGLPVVRLGAITDDRKNKGGVTYNTGQNTETDPQAFTAMLKSGHRGVMNRLGKSRLPIVEKRGDSLSELTDHTSTTEAVKTSIITSFRKEFIRLFSLRRQGKM